MRKFHKTLITLIAAIGIYVIVSSLFAKPISPSNGQAMAIVYVTFEEITP